MTRFLLVAAFALTAGTAIAADEAPLTLSKTIPLKGVDGKLDHLAVDSKGERLFVANKPNNTLDIVDLKTSKLVKQIADQGKISGVAYAADLDMVYAGNGAGTCNGFAGADYKLAFSTKAPGADNVHYNSETKLVYVGCGETLMVLDAKTGEAKTSIKLPGAVHGFKIDKKAGKILWQREMMATGNTGCHPKTNMAASTPVADASGVYWTQPSAGLVRVSVSLGGPVDTLASNEVQPHSLVTDATSVYWLTHGGKLKRLAKGATPGTLATTFAAGFNTSFAEMRVRALAQNAQYLVWITTDGRVLRMAK